MENNELIAVTNESRTKTETTQKKPLHFSIPQKSNLI